MEYSEPVNNDSVLEKIADAYALSTFRFVLV